MMDFIDRIKEIAGRIPKQIDYIQTEEATKNAFVMPFISALGFDVFNPMEVVPEYISDVGTKKGEKVDYAILSEGQPIMLFECKNAHANLNQVHCTQLTRYFTFTAAGVGVLTNGILYHFYSDLNKKNVMDDKPFLIFDILNFKEPEIEEIKKFTKTRFDMEDILSSASELKYTREIRRLMAREFNDPSEDFVRLFAKQVYSGVLNQNAREMFAKFTRTASKQFLSDLINERLSVAMTNEADVSVEEEPDPVEEEPQREIVTSQDELEGYVIVKTILRETVDPDKVHMRDTLSYCGVLFDDNNRKPICRLRFNRSQKYLGLFKPDNKTETRVPIDRLHDIYDHTDTLRVMALHYANM
jgi:hypothetical protein